MFFRFTIFLCTIRILDSSQKWGYVLFVNYENALGFGYFGNFLDYFLRLLFNFVMGFSTLFMPRFR